MVARCKPLTKDHLLLKTAFAGTKGWSVVTGFTVYQNAANTIPQDFRNAMLISGQTTLGEKDGEM